MGAAHSSQPRSVSMENPTPSGVIEISDDVVHRLKKSMAKKAKEDAVAAPPPPSPKKESRVEPKKAEKPASPTQQKVVYERPQTIYVQSGGPTLSAMDVRRQMEDELHKNDAQWRQRMAKLEETLKKTNVIMEQEYTAAVEDVRKRFATAAPSHQLPPCQDLKAQLIACYKAHPGETLKCAEEVAMFRNCVSANRIKKLDAQEEREKSTTEKTSTSNTSAPAKAAKAG